MSKKTFKIVRTIDDEMHLYVNGSHVGSYQSLIAQERAENLFRNIAEVLDITVEEQEDTDEPGDELEDEDEEQELAFEEAD